MQGPKLQTTFFSLFRCNCVVVLQLLFSCLYANRIFPKYAETKSLANSVDPDQTPQNAASDQGLHCLPVIQLSLDNRTVSRLDMQF